MTTSSRHPFEVFVLVVAFAVGVPALFFSAIPPTISASFAQPIVMAWGFTITGGSGVALFGITRRNRVNGLILEQIGLAAVAMAMLLYVFAVLTVAGRDAAIPAAFFAGFGAACLWRCGQIQRLLSAAVRKARSQ